MLLPAGALVGFVLGNIWRTIALAALLALGVATLAGRYVVSQRDAARVTLAQTQAANAALNDAWKADIDRLTGLLADAKADGEAAIAEKAKAEKAAADKLKARERYWAGVYGRDPQARAWSEQPIPAGVLEGLR